MKKILLFILAIALVSVVAFAQEIVPLHGSGTNGLWLCHDPGAPTIQCETATAPENTFKCCWKNDPLINKGGKGSKSGKSSKGGKGAISNKGVNAPKVATAPKSAQETTKPVKVQPTKATSKNTK